MSTPGRLSLSLWNERFAAPPLPMNPAEVAARGWDAVDLVFVSGDAYVDHPSFAMAILARTLEAAGFRVGMLGQPDWRSAAGREAGPPGRALGRAVADVRPAAAVLRRVGGEHGLDDQPLHGEQEGP